jgi:hypothetical protein
MAHREAATAHCLRSIRAGNGEVGEDAWASSFPDGVVRAAAWICEERFADRKAVTRLVRSSGGGGARFAIVDAVARESRVRLGSVVSRTI